MVVTGGFLGDIGRFNDELDLLVLFHVRADIFTEMSGLFLEGITGRPLVALIDCHTHLLNSCFLHFPREGQLAQ